MDSIEHLDILSRFDTMLRYSLHMAVNKGRPLPIDFIALLIERGWLDKLKLEDEESSRVPCLEFKFLEHKVQFFDLTVDDLTLEGKKTLEDDTESIKDD